MNVNQLRRFTFIVLCCAVNLFDWRHTNGNSFRSVTAFATNGIGSCRIAPQHRMYRVSSSMKQLSAFIQRPTVLQTSVSSQQSQRCRKHNIMILSSQNNNVNNNEDFWEKQKALVYEMKDIEKRSKKEIAVAKYRQRAIALIYDTAYISFYIFCALWFLFPNPFVPLSYSLGAICGVAYAFGLSKYVESVGGSIDDIGTGNDPGAGVGAARFAFLILLFLFVSKFRSVGLLEIPSILGFFTYQLASISQGLREIND